MTFTLTRFSTAMDGGGFMQQRCFVHAQNSPSTVVHGCTTVEDGSNGLTASIILRFYLLCLVSLLSCQINIPQYRHGWR